MPDFDIIPKNKNMVEKLNPQNPTKPFLKFKPADNYKNFI